MINKDTNLFRLIEKEVIIYKVSCFGFKVSDLTLRLYPMQEFQIFNSLFLSIGIKNFKSMNILG